jgi:alpha-1,6-mannosyltransferase
MFRSTDWDRSAWSYWLPQLVLVFGLALLWVPLSGHLAWGVVLEPRFSLLFAGTFRGASVLFGFLAWRSIRHPGSRRTLMVVIATGLAIRLLLLPTAPILEDDGYRYMWDGAVVAEGLNPYRHPPLRFLAAPEVTALLADRGLSPTPLPEGYEGITADGRAVLGRVNHPFLTTIYPPVAQAGFALAHVLAPWNFIGWKLVVLAAECVTLLLLLGSLRSLGRPAIWAGIYWLHPLALKEFANSGHMDALLLPGLAGAAWAVAAGRHRLVGVALALASAVKLWPLLLVPAALGRGRRAVMIGTGAALAAILLILPQLLALQSEAGLSSFASGWQRNALAFAVLESALAGVVEDPGLPARLLVATVIGGTAVYCWRRSTGEREERLATMAALTGLLLLLAPVGYAWYATWLLPLIALRPDPRWLILTACVPAYYLRFQFQADIQPGFERWLPPLLSFGPAWIAILWMEARKRWPAAA